MIQDYTIFTSYILAPTGTTGHGYSKAIHCNYIRSIGIETDNLDIQEILINFSGGTTGATAPFKFLCNSVGGGTGFTAHQIFALIQSAVTSTTGITTPIASKWKIIDVTNQISGHMMGNPLTATELTNTIFKIPLNVYNSYSGYTLSYLNYPSSLPIADNELCFGDEIYFLGNVSSEIHADVYVTDLSINLPLNEFNSSSNLTWDGISSVAITEIGIYTEIAGVKYLVAIGKLNNPITKDSTISRTIAFAIDF